MATRLELSPSNVEVYLRERGLLPPDARARVTPLSGGISNLVLRVDFDGGAVVVKQSLPVLRVEERWEFDPSRIIVERECMAALAELLPTGSVREVLASDNDQPAREPARGLLVRGVGGGPRHPRRPQRGRRARRRAPGAGCQSRGL